LLDAQAVRRAREAVLWPFEHAGLWRDGAWRLDAAPPGRWPKVGNRRPEVESLVRAPALLAAVEGLLNGHPIDWTLHKRPQILVTPPDTDRWTLPTGWHPDSPRLASGESLGVQLFALLDTVEPRGGGTLAVAGSHRLVDEGRFLRAADIAARLRREAFFKGLYAGEPSDGEGGGLPKGAVGDVPLEVIELTGAPGDVYLMDLRLLHSAAPNASTRPRMMITHRFARADLTVELAEGYDWP
jgi:ectoine hydroxylase-related dioxygenase (phytanoyl-CoA dioxygenase family)